MPCGSGETLVALATAYPAVRWVAVYDDGDPATQYEERAPLNGLVAAFATVRRIPRRVEPVDEAKTPA